MLKRKTKQTFLFFYGRYCKRLPQIIKYIQSGIPSGYPSAEEVFLSFHYDVVENALAHYEAKSIPCGTY